MSPKVKEVIKKSIDEFVFGFVLLLISSGTLYYSLHNNISDLQVLSFVAVKLSLYIFTGSVFVKFLNGVGCDINKEIFEEHNIAASIFVGLFWVGLAIAIAAGNLG